MVTALTSPQDSAVVDLSTDVTLDYGVDRTIKHSGSLLSFEPPKDWYGWLSPNTQFYCYCPIPQLIDVGELFVFQVIIEITLERGYEQPISGDWDYLMLKDEKALDIQQEFIWLQNDSKAKSILCWASGRLTDPLSYVTLLLKFLWFPGDATLNFAISASFYSSKTIWRGRVNPVLHTPSSVNLSSLRAK